jgi:hypothetical protein
MSIWSIGRTTLKWGIRNGDIKYNLTKIQRYIIVIGSNDTGKMCAV